MSDAFPNARSADGTVALVGLPGSGKTAVGRALALLLGRPFLDLDELVEQRTGRTPAAWLDTEPEPRFREVESSALQDTLRDAPAPGSGWSCAVIATGGGSVIDPLNRWALAETATTVWLDADDDTLLHRLRESSVDRPLLRHPNGPAIALAALRSAREPFYRVADVHVDATPSVEQVAASLAQELASMQPDLRGRRLFDAIVARNHPNGAAHARVVMGLGFDATTLRDAMALAPGADPLVVADERAAAALPALFGALPGTRGLGIHASEKGKRLRSAERLLEAASEMGMERGDPWIAFGGGTTGDLVGTAAALYHRGAPLIQVPTTWLGQADSAIGGKVAVDLARAKNAVGAFWPPVAVVADVAALRTLPRARLLDGMAESLKCGLIGDPELWSLIEERGLAAVDPKNPDEAARYAIVERAARLKLGVVDRDPYERGERRSLNLGHTIGHALEVESGYTLPHGQAVVLGLRAVAAIAAQRGAEAGLSERIDALISSLGYDAQRAFDPAAVRLALGTDKKRIGGRQHWILPMAVGRVEDVSDVTDAELDLALLTISGEVPARTPARAPRPKAAAAVA